MSEVILTYRGRTVTSEDVVFINNLIKAHPESSRRKLSSQLCEAWDWRQSNGALKDMVCRSLMLSLHRSGHIRLPEIRCVMPNPLAKRKRPDKLIDYDETPVTGKLKDHLPGTLIKKVRRTPDELLFNRLIETYHYLNYSQPVGEHLKYMVFCEGRPIACLAWCSPAFQLGLRDHHIGWNRKTRQSNLKHIAYNTRYLILPWVRIPNLASYLLGVMARNLPKDWTEAYQHPVYYLETFVLPERYPGTCYKAANWISLGLSNGRGSKAPDHQKRVSVKELLVYPLVKDFRQALSEQ